MLGGIIWLGIDGIRSGYGFWKLTLRFIVLLCVMKVFDIVVQDQWLVMTLGYFKKIFGSFGTEDVIISSKFTPMGRYKAGQVRKSLMKIYFNRKKKKLRPLYELMEKIGDNHKLTVPQVAMSFCSSKGIVPVCGCRKPYQVEQLEAAVNIKLTDEEILQLEKEAERLNVKILGADIFRFAVRK